MSKTPVPIFWGLEPSGKIFSLVGVNPAEKPVVENEGSSLLGRQWGDATALWRQRTVIHHPSSHFPRVGRWVWLVQCRCRQSIIEAEYIFRHGERRRSGTKMAPKTRRGILDYCLVLQVPNALCAKADESAGPNRAPRD